jgi:hypothetical protein
VIIADVGEHRIQDPIPTDPRIRYVAFDWRLLLAEKRSRACELARGELILDSDDDDGRLLSASPPSTGARIPWSYRWCSTTTDSSLP